MTIFIIKSKGGRCYTGFPAFYLRHINNSKLNYKIASGLTVDVSGLSRVARQLRTEAGDTQEDTAERIGRSQEQVSRAERGVPSHASICILVIEEYTGFEVEYPLYRLVKARED